MPDAPGITDLPCEERGSDARTRILTTAHGARRCGHQRPGGTVLHCVKGAGGKGALLSGDIVQVVQDNKSVSFMWSFPNFIPLSAPRVEGVVKSLKPRKFDRIHGAFTDRTIWSDGKGVLEKSRAPTQSNSRRSPALTGCLPVPPGCYPTGGKTFDGSPSGFDVMVCPSGNPRQRLHQEVSSAHSSLDRAQRVFNGLAFLAHLFGMLVKPALHRFENMLMLPSGDASLLNL